MIEGSREEEIYKELKEKGLEQKYGKPGIYKISIEDKLVYIGKARDMLIRIANHLTELEQNTKSNKYKVLRQAKTAGRKINFDVMYYSLCPIGEDIDKDIGFMEGELIRFYKPPLNYQIPKKEDYRKYEVNKSAKYITLEQIFV